MKLAATRRWKLAVGDSCSFLRQSCCCCERSHIRYSWGPCHLDRAPAERHRNHHLRGNNGNSRFERRYRSVPKLFSTLSSLTFARLFRGHSSDLGEIEPSKIKRCSWIHAQGVLQMLRGKNDCENDFVPAVTRSSSHQFKSNKTYQKLIVEHIGFKSIH